MSTLLLLSGCVQIHRFRYITFESMDGIQSEGTALPSSEDYHLVSVSPMPAEYKLTRAEYSLRFTRARTPYPGGVVISALSLDGGDLRVMSQEAALAVPGYGACRAYYAAEEFSSLLFFDECPSSLSRSFEILITVEHADGTATEERIPYVIRNNGFWWLPDGP